MKAIHRQDKVTGEAPARLVTAEDGFEAKAPVVANISESDPADMFVACTPSDDTTYDPPPNGIWVGVTGDLVIEGRDGGQVSLTVPAGSLLPLRPRKVLASTSASEIILLYNP